MGEKRCEAESIFTVSFGFCSGVENAYLKTKSSQLKGPRSLDVTLAASEG